MPTTRVYAPDHTSFLGAHVCVSKYIRFVNVLVVYNFKSMICVFELSSTLGSTPKGKNLLLKKQILSFKTRYL